MSALLRDLQVLLPAVTVLDCPLGTVLQDLVKFLVSDLGQSLGTESGGDVLVQLINEFVLPSTEVLQGEVGLYQTDPAVDVESDTPG